MGKVVLKNVKKIYDKNVIAVHDFNLEIENNEFVVLVGPSGCGKSTTLRMIAGLEEISDGEIYIGDKMVNYMPPKDRDIAMVFQNYALYPHMTVYENMAFSLKLKKMKKKEIDAKVKEAAQILDITQYLERKPKALSGGQKQRVAIGRAIVRNPQVFLMDEPLSNLDAKLRNEMRAEIIKLRKRIQTTFIYVTHDQTEAMTLGDRIVIMKDGFIQQIGTPYEVFNHPKNLFVASFIGSPQMNFFDGKLYRDKNQYYVDCQGIRFDLPAEKNDALLEKNQQPEDIIIGIRPEHVFLEQSNNKAISAIMDIYEMMGVEVHIHAKIDGKDILLKTAMDEVPKNLLQNAQAKSEIRLGFNVNFMHMFHKESEENLI